MAGLFVELCGATILRVHLSRFVVCESGASRWQSIYLRCLLDMPRASSLRIALLEFRVRVGPRVLHRDSDLHIAPESLPGVIADLVGNQFEFFTPLMFCLGPMPSHFPSFPACCHSVCRSILVQVGSILSLAIILKSVWLRSRTS